ncbi:MAG: IS3 family transposase [Chlorobi bacterium]|nr:IS3 family transposase [Chlorobiota bacterium]
MGFVQFWAKKSGIAVTRFIEWLAVAPSKYYDWQSRYGKVNEHNGLNPRDFWLEESEKQAIVNFHLQFPLEGYRRLTYMMLDRDIVAVSPSSVYRVLSAAGLLQCWNRKPGKKGTGFVQPLRPHEHWHIDVSYVNILGTFYYLCSILDGCSRYIVHWELREATTEKDIEIILQRAREKFPESRPRIISDNGPQFIAKDFKEYIRLTGMSHVRTSPFYPQSNGKLERYHKTIKTECIRPKVALSLEDARNQLADYIRFYNDDRLHSAIGYIAPNDKLGGRDRQIFKERDQKLEAAREARKQKRLQMRRRLDSNQVVHAAINLNQLTLLAGFSIFS